MAKQTVQGKGFEFAVLQAFYHYLLEHNHACLIAKNKAYHTAKKSYESLDDAIQAEMAQAALASLKPILKSEPQLSNGEELITLSIAIDKKGDEGDVRDLILSKIDTGWEIGISCKHNHHALKHSRLSSQIDFGEKWLGLPASKTYFDAITPIFKRLSDLRDETKDCPKETQHKWSMLEDKEESIYLPVLEAFKEELLRLDREYDQVPRLLITYLLGRQDFYKVIAKDSDRKTVVQAFNLNDGLSLSYDKMKPQTKVKSLAPLLPTKIYSFDYKVTGKQRSKTTLELVMDNGWSISFRIHNASSRIEPSLKFDIQLIGIPQSVTNVDEYWD